MASIILFIERYQPFSFQLTAASGTLSNASLSSISPSTLPPTKELFLKIILIVFVASHGFILVRVLIWQIVEKIFWKESSEVEESEKKKSTTAPSLITTTRPSPRPQKVDLHFNCCANWNFEADHDYADTPFFRDWTLNTQVLNRKIPHVIDTSRCFWEQWQVREFSDFF